MKTPSGVWSALAIALSYLIGKAHFSVDRAEVRLESAFVQLSNLPFLILNFLCANAGKKTPWTDIYEHAWKTPFTKDLEKSQREQFDTQLKILRHNLRQVIPEALISDDIISNTRKLGYSLAVEVIPQYAPEHQQSHWDYGQFRTRLSATSEGGSVLESGVVLVSSNNPLERRSDFMEVLLDNLVDAKVRCTFLMHSDEAYIAGELLGRLIQKVRKARAGETEEALELIRANLTFYFSNQRARDSVYVLNAQSPHDAGVYYCFDQNEQAYLHRTKTDAGQYARDLQDQIGKRGQCMIAVQDPNEFEAILESILLEAKHYLDASDHTFLERILPTLPYTDGKQRLDCRHSKSADVQRRGIGKTKPKAG